MKISVIIPIYNSENYLDRLLKSILEQTYNNYELILVDDGSNDNSLNIIYNYSDKDKRIKVISKENEGPGLTRKKGFEESNGDLLFFIDSDDWLPDSNVFERIIDIYNKEKFEILMFDYQCYGLNEITRGNSLKNIKLTSGTYPIETLNQTIIAGSMCSKIFVREKMKLNYFSPGDNFEDVYTTYKYLENCKTFYYFNSICYCINRNDNINSLTRTVNLNKIKKSTEIILNLCESNSLIGSKKILAFDMYIYNMKYLLRYKGIDKKKNILYMHQLRRIFKNNGIYICIKYFSFKRLLFYIYIIIFC